MKVGIDVSSAIFGTGVSDYTLELLRHLPSDVMVPVGFSLRRLADFKHLIPNCTTYPIPPTILHYLWNKLHVFNFENFAPGNIDIYHSSDWAQAPDSSKLVTTIHDLAPFLYPTETSPQIVEVHKARLNWVVRECHGIICVSKSTEKHLHQVFPKTAGRTIVIPEALPSRFQLAPQKSPFKNYLSAIGARQGRKNIHKLISSYLNFRSRLRLPEKLIIIGESSEKISDPSVIYTGYIPDQDLVNILAGSKAFVYPSLHEGFGLPILVAFHHQVPVACSDIPVFHETAGLAVEYFDPTSQDSIAHGISKAIKRSTHLTSLGSEQLSKFSWTDTGHKTLNVYKSLC